MAISAIDATLWDLKGHWLGQPVYRLLGGPIRETIPAYASMLGHSLEPERVRERTRAIVAEGYTATKWFPRHGPVDGRAGMARNEELMAALREAAGPDVDVMLDAWMSWDVPYTVEMAERLKEYRPRWIEEPVLPDKIAACAEIRRRSPVPIATGEHEYTRWGFQRLLLAEAVDVIQADPDWCGGISELVKICTLASTFGRSVVPHGHSVPAAVQVIASQPPHVCPMAEYLILAQPVAQHFHATFVQPEGGSLALSTAPGLGIALDEAKVERREELG
jgi:L-alanine-DL-glutamate epimerase-like enolase superfamily enzyme